MVSRSTGTLRRIVPAVAVSLSALLVGCSAGQVTQTDSIEPAVNGNRGDVGDIALRDTLLAYPESGDYREDDDAPLVLTIVNTGDAADELVSVSSPAAREVELIGDPSLPGRTSLHVVVPDESTETTESSAPSDTSTPETSESSETDATDPSAPPSASESPSATESAELETEIGRMSIVLTGLVQDLPPGRNVPVTFVFANAGQITVNLPIATPTTSRPDPTDDGEDSGH
ncbi:copper chaperone PCu(A)C [Actinophytocola sediminis]